MPYAISETRPFTVMEWYLEGFSPLAVRRNTKTQTDRRISDRQAVKCASRQTDRRIERQTDKRKCPSKCPSKSPLFVSHSFQIMAPWISRTSRKPLMERLPCFRIWPIQWSSRRLCRESKSEIEARRSNACRRHNQADVSRRSGKNPGDQLLLPDQNHRSGQGQGLENQIIF